MRLISARNSRVPIGSFRAAAPADRGMDLTGREAPGRTRVAQATRRTRCVACPQLFSEAQIRRCRQKRSNGAEELMARMRYRRDACPLEAAFLQHAPGRRIGRARAGIDRVMAEIAERLVDQSAHGLGRIAASPKRRADPIADLGVRSVAPFQSAGAGERAVAQSDEEDFVPRVRIGERDPVLRIGEAVGMRDTRGVFRDPAIIDERGDDGGVRKTRRSQNEPLGLEDVPARFSDAISADVQKCHHTGSFHFKNAEGEPNAGLPLVRTRSRVRRVTECRRTL